MSDIPDGFARHDRTSPLTAPWEPLWFRAADGAMGLRIVEAHCNSRGLAHGGLIAALADNIMGIACARARASRPVTAGLSVDYLGPARMGQWLEFVPEVDKAGATLGFATCRVTADGTLCARARATFAMGA
jgi:uncharacterized protein (TIGR00369 family)